MSSECTFENLCYFVNSKNEVNLHRRRLLRRASNLQNKWTQYRVVTFGGIFTSFKGYDGETYECEDSLDSHEYIWFNDEAKVEYDRLIEKLERIKAKGRKRMPRIKKIYKKIGAKLKWDDSGYVRYIEFDGNRFHRNDVAKMAEKQKVIRAFERALK